MKQVGILAGTFDPVHAGHIGFALAAAQAAGLDQVIFLPERAPRGKAGVTDFKFRLRALQSAIQNHKTLQVLGLPDAQFTIAGTLPQLQSRFPGSKLVFLFGSDVVRALPAWPDVNRLSVIDLIIGVRAGDSRADIQKILSGLASKAKITYLNSPKPHLSSSQMRSRQ